MPFPLLLALDTSTGPCSVALARGARVLAYRRMDEFRSQSKLLLNMIDEAFEEAKLKPSGLDAVASTLGPGSFTSLRIGLSAARGLALALGKPFIGLSTLRVLAHGASGGERDILCAVNAHRGEVYAQLFSPGGEASGEAFVLPAAELADKMKGRKLTVAGNARAQLEPLLSAAYLEEVSHPDARWLAALASDVHARGGATSPNPIYIRPPDAKLPS